MLAPPTGLNYESVVGYLGFRGFVNSVMSFFQWNETLVGEKSLYYIS